MTAERRLPRVLLCADFQFGSTSHGILDGLRGLGWETYYADLARFVPGWTSLTLRIIRRALGRAAIEEYRRFIRDSVVALSPDVVLTVKGIHFDQKLLDFVKARGSTVVMFYPDCYFDHPGVDAGTFGEYDAFITTKSFHLGFLQSVNSEDRASFCHHGYVPGVHAPCLENVEECDHAYDVCYVGNHSPYKEAWLRSTFALLPELKWIVVGNRWAERVRNEPLSRAILGAPLTGRAYARLIQMSRVNVALHSGPVSNGWEDLVSTRTFEVPACKGFMLHIDNPEVRALFDVASEIDVFASPEQLAERILYYRHQPELRQSMLRAAYRRAVPAYSLSTRCREIDQVLRRTIGARSFGRGTLPLR